MKKLMMTAGAVAVVGIMAGCAFNPEAMPVGPKDSTVYVDPGAPKSLDPNEAKAKVAVMASVGGYKAYQQVADSLDSYLNSKLSAFSFFEVVDRKSAKFLINDAVASGSDPAEAVKGVEADFVVIARITSIAVRETKTQNSAFYSTDVAFDFRWISKEDKKVIMTESFKPSVGTVSSQTAVVGAVSSAAEEAVKGFCAKIAAKYAPPARVLETRGDGAAARISIGTNYGVGENTDVCFYEIVDNSDVGGEKRDMRDIATGKVKLVEAKSAWVKVNDSDKTNVRKGVYVRVLGLHKDTLLDMPGNLLGN